MSPVGCTRPTRCLIYESGCIGAKPTRLPASIGDGVLSENADAVIGVPEIFAYWLQAGKIDVGFLGAAQIDRFANINTTVIGPYDDPKVRLPGRRRCPRDRRQLRFGHRHVAALRRARSSSRSTSSHRSATAPVPATS